MKSLEKIYSLLFESYNEQGWDDSASDKTEIENFQSNVDDFVIEYNFRKISFYKIFISLQKKAKGSYFFKKTYNDLEHNLKLLFDIKTLSLYEEFAEYLIDTIKT